jgi:hypothetical protein
VAEGTGGKRYEQVMQAKGKTALEVERNEVL